MVIGISFDSPEEYPEVTGPDDRFAEFEPESTIQAMEEAIRYIGATPIRVGGPKILVKSRPEVDVIWNISEGYGTRNREAWVPVLCEMYGIPCLGSDALSLSISLDKHATKLIAERIRIPTSPWVLARYPATIDKSMKSGKRSKTDAVENVINEVRNTLNNRWPLFVKPRYEGTGKGIISGSKVYNETSLAEEVSRQFTLYTQDLIIESFLDGAEFTVAVTGTPMICHPVLERALDAVTGIGYHVIDSGQSYRLNNNLTPEIEHTLQSWSIRICNEMDVLDFARLDFKMDDLGNPHFLEINTLPTFAIDNNFAILAELSQVPYQEFLGQILRQAVERVM